MKQRHFIDSHEALTGPAVAALARYPRFEAWRRRTGLLFPSLR